MYDSLKHQWGQGGNRRGRYEERRANFYRCLEVVFLIHGHEPGSEGSAIKIVLIAIKK